MASQASGSLLQAQGIGASTALTTSDGKGLDEGVPIVRKRGRPKKGEEANKKEKVDQSRDDHSKAKAGPSSKAGQNGTEPKIERRGRPRKGEEKNVKAKGKEGAAPIASTSLTIEGEGTQEKKKETRGRPKKGQEKTKNTVSGAGADDATRVTSTSANVQARMPISGGDVSGTSDRDVVQAAAAVDESTVKEAVTAKRQKLTSKKDQQGKKKGPVEETTSSEAQKSDSTGEREENRQTTAPSIVEDEERSTNEGRRQEHSNPAEVEQSPNNVTDGTMSSLPETSMLVEREKEHTFSLRSFTSRRPHVRNNPNSDVTSRLATERILDEQVHIMLANGQGGFNRLADSNVIAFERVMECYMGPIQQQSLQLLAMGESRSLADLVSDTNKKGALLNTGGYTYSLDWRYNSKKDDFYDQHLCVSASTESNPRTLIGEKLNPSSSSVGRLQLWSVNENMQAKLEYFISFHQGRISCVRWLPSLIPIGESEATLGLLAACMQDGTVGIYAIPRPDVVRKDTLGIQNLTLDPLVQLDVKKGVPTCLAWYNSDKLAIAYSDGWVSIWNLFKCLKAGSKGVRPQIFARVSSSPISSLVWDTNGQQIFVSAYDGSAQCMQLAHPHLSTTLHHSRDVCYAIEFSEALGVPIMERPESDEVRTVDFVDGKMSGTLFCSHLGRVRTLAVSNLHPFIASGGADGSVRVSNTGYDKSALKAKKYTHKFSVMTIFRLDLHRGNGSFRMIENLALLPPMYRTRHGSSSTVAWDPAISQTCIRWNPNQDKEDWLVSGMACGLVRIDFVASL